MVVTFQKLHQSQAKCFKYVNNGRSGLRGLVYRWLTTLLEVPHSDASLKKTTMDASFLGTCELETIQAVQNIEGLSQLCEESVNTSAHVDPLGLKRLVDSITPPGFDNLYKQPKNPQLQDITNNSGYRRAFKPNLTSSPEVLLGKRCNRGPSSSRKRIRLEDSCILLDTDLNNAGQSTNGESVLHNDVQDVLNKDEWSEDLTDIWDQNSFSEPVEKTVAAAPPNVGINASDKHRDTDANELRSNQEHEHQDQVGPDGDLNSIGEVLTVLRQISEENRKILLDNKSITESNRKLTEACIKSSQDNERLSQLNAKISQENLNNLIELRRQSAINRRHEKGIQEIHKQLNIYLDEFRKFDMSGNVSKDQFKSLIQIMFKMQKALEIKLSPFLPIAGPSSRV
ncbi:uncharacterized protein LOC125801697 isoform X3 [Astyanax mexicanus]|uniref:uncharacterized protein LOC125801697 isoform X3 n=1 Tax=Astyanax mexicanus TaxID=7994 RepID=UPI0020CAD5F9|nr:uncharacterized protein LOC125801697 isoform X3 [Astyanax mexicanus]